MYRVRQKYIPHFVGQYMYNVGVISAHPVLILILLISKSVRSATTPKDEGKGRDVYRRADPLRLVGDGQ
jgi:hypothetical protein